MSEQKTQLPPSPEQMALDIASALISAGCLNHSSGHMRNDLEETMRQARQVYVAALHEFKKV